MRKPLIILPFGIYYNKELLEATEGDILLFTDRIEREIEYITPIRANTSYTDFLCKKTYATNFARLKEKWKANIEFEGYNIKAVHEDKVLLIYLKEIPKQEEKGNERKRTK